MGDFTFLTIVLFPAVVGAVIAEWLFGTGGNAAWWGGGIGLAIGFCFFVFCSYVEHREQEEKEEGEDKQYRREMKKLKAQERARKQELELERLRRGEPSHNVEEEVR